MSGGIPISTILPQRNNNSELTSYQSEKKLRGFNNSNNMQANQIQMKIQQQKGQARGNQFVIEEEGHQSQRSSEEESYSMGRSVGGTSGTKHVGANAAKSFKISQQQTYNN